MTSRDAVVQESTARQHVVQFFDTAESVGQTVATYVTEGLASDDVVLVVARPATWTNVVNRLGPLAADVHGSMDAGRLIVLNADAILAKITRQSWPDSDRFDAVIGELVRELASRGRVRVYGELVDILAGDAQFRAAMALEDLWNSLANEVPFSLLCGYSAVHFGSERNDDALRLICRCHSATQVDDDDDLATWLLERPEAHGATVRS